MYDFRSYLKNLSESTGINFNLLGVDGIVYYESIFDSNSSDILESDITIGKQKARLVTESKYEICIPLLKYSIENKYRESSAARDQLLMDILEGKEISKDKLSKSPLCISKGATLLLISVDGSRYEALNIIKRLYKNQNVMSVIYGENIVVIGNFEDSLVHAKGIREAIISDLYCKCFVGFGRAIDSVNNIKNAFEEAKECLIIGKRFEVKGEIYDYRKLLFEKVVYSIDDKVKKELLNKLKNKFSLFDREMINTIETFINCDLNISDASKRLYIHRNTLIYRLDKIHKDTGYDIREFKQATVFIIAFLVWKERS